MIFTSPAFIIFFLIVFLPYLAIKNRLFRHVLLLISSSVFYGWWDYRYLALMWTVIFIAYGTALLATSRPEHKKCWIAIATAALLSLIAVFKYNNFFLQSLAGLAGVLGVKAQIPMVNILLPVGISFYVFHGISYIVDVYREIIPAQKSLMNVALYISYFPQLVAGPIVRASNFIPQLNKDVEIDQYMITTGLREFTVGFIYKAVFADNLAKFGDPIFTNLGAYSNLSIVCATLAFYGQIYFDFAGYSQMAIGLARMMGYNFPPNFNHPYQATSITDFWRRWHISLSTWLRNYLYIPLGGNRCGKLKQYRNLLITMLLGGLWHGASWNFVLWGGLHGAALAIHKFASGEDGESKPRLPHQIIFAWLLTQCFVLLCWVPFRVPHFSQTMEVFSAFLGIRNDRGLQQAAINYGFLLLPLVVDTFISQDDTAPLRKVIAWIPQPARAVTICFLIGILFALALAMMSMNVGAFIYFQF